MLKKLHNTPTAAGKKPDFLPECPIRESTFPEPFGSTLEYNAPARGPWNIVHTGMLIPESHQIFICARGCLRGVILTAAEMNVMDRMSYVTVEEEDFIAGTLEENIVEGVCTILNRMEYKPKAVLVFISCIHMFAGNDMDMILSRLRERFPDVSFTDCYMHPTMRKRMLTPDQTMRKQLYSFLENTAEKDLKQINIIGNDRITKSEMLPFLVKHGFTVRDIASEGTFASYKEMEKSFLNLVYLPTALAAGRDLEIRLNQKLLYLPLCYNIAKIRSLYEALTSFLHLPLPPELDHWEKEAMQSLRHALDLVKDTFIDIDYTATPRPLGLARLLLERGFHVRRVYVDTLIPEEKEDWEYLKSHYGDLLLAPTVRPEMRFAHPGTPANEKILCIGQKAAYFNNSGHFVNMVAGGGFYGYAAITETALLLEEAFTTEKKTENVIQQKGWGCVSCL